MLEKNCSENLISSNHFYRSYEPWAPMKDRNNGLDDLYGLVYICGDNNTVTANHFSEIIDAENITPSGASPVIIHIVSGEGNYIAVNHIVAATEAAEPEDAESCFATQVEAMLSTGRSMSIDIIAVQIEKDSVQNIVLDTGREDQVILDRENNAFRGLPVPGIGK